MIHSRKKYGNVPGSTLLLLLAGTLLLYFLIGYPVLAAEDVIIKPNEINIETVQSMPLIDSFMNGEPLCNNSENKTLLSCILYEISRPKVIPTGTIESRTILITNNNPNTSITDLSITPGDISTQDNRYAILPVMIDAPITNTTLNPNGFESVPIFFYLNTVHSGDYVGYLQISSSATTSNERVEIKIKDCWVVPLLVLTIFSFLSVFLSGYITNGRKRDEIKIKLGNLANEFNDVEVFLFPTQEQKQIVALFRDPIRYKINEVFNFSKSGQFDTAEKKYDELKNLWDFWSRPDLKSKWLNNISRTDILFRVFDHPSARDIFFNRTKIDARLNDEQVNLVELLKSKIEKQKILISLTSSSAKSFAELEAEIKDSENRIKKLSDSISTITKNIESASESTENAKETASLIRDKKELFSDRATEQNVLIRLLNKQIYEQGLLLINDKGFDSTSLEKVDNEIYEKNVTILFLMDPDINILKTQLMNYWESAANVLLKIKNCNDNDVDANEYKNRLADIENSISFDLSIAAISLSEAEKSPNFNATLDFTAKTVKKIRNICDKVKDEPLAGVVFAVIAVGWLALWIILFNSIKTTFSLQDDILIFVVSIIPMIVISLTILYYRNVWKFLTRHCQTLLSRFWLWAYIVISGTFLPAVLLIVLGFTQIYSSNPVFGANGALDYVTLLFWAFVTGPTSEKFSQIVQKYQIPPVEPEPSSGTPATAQKASSSTPDINSSLPGQDNQKT
ncbi:MAG: hypothetical protein LUQ31_07100 [Methanoregula sp.]|nr:hypothetical protein [Methanoregula sp.]